MKRHNTVMNTVDTAVTDSMNPILDGEKLKKKDLLDLIHEFRSLGSADLIQLSKVCLFLTAISLLLGYPEIACLASGCDLLLFLLQKKPTIVLLQDMKKWFIVSLVAFFASLGSIVLLTLALNYTYTLYNVIWVFGKASHGVSGLLLAYYLMNNDEDEPEDNTNSIQFMQINVRIFEGRSLVAKDKNIFGKKTTSDPYVKIYFANNYVGETSIIWKTLNPIWKNEIFSIPVVPKALSEFDTVELNIYDRDKFSSDDSMGTVLVPIPRNLNMKVSKWYSVEAGKGADYCRNATGELQAEVELRPLLSRNFKKQLHRVSSMRMSSKKLM